MAIITLTTDYGWSDYYVGAMKGIIYQIAPQATVVDITHEIPPHDVLAGALILREIWRTFPAKTIHVVVVDPGVGSERPILLAKYAEHLFLVPDNGLVTLVHQLYKPEQVNLVSNNSLFCQPVSDTFHGRDIFAPVAAHLSKGVGPDQVGPRTGTICLLDIGVPYPQGTEGLAGRIIHVDRFGNLITNIPAEMIQAYYTRGRIPTIFLGETSLGPLRKTFSEVALGQPLAYLGSAGLLEIAVNQGRADHFFKPRPDTQVLVR
jgi:S-adenosylmethionine hydrolase